MKVFHRIWFWIRAVIVLAVGLVVVGDLYCEVVGLPEMGRRYVLDRLEQRGIYADTGEVYFGLLAGLAIEDLTVWDAERPGARLMTAGSCRVTLAPASLLRGRLAARTVVVRDGRLFIPVPGAAATDRPAPLVVEALGLTVGFGGDALEVRQLTGTVAGIRLDLSGTVQSRSRVLKAGRQPEAPGSAHGWRLSWRTVSAPVPPRVLAQLPLFREYCGRQLFVSDDAVVKAAFRVDLAHPELARVDGTFQVSDILVRGVQIRRCRGRFGVAANIARLENTTVYIGEDNVVTGWLEYNLRTHILRGSAAGSLDPSPFFQAFDRPMPAWLAETHFAVPPGFTLDLDPSPLDPASWRGRCSIKADHILYGSNHLQRLTASLSRKPGRLDVEALSAVWADGQQQVKGSLAFDEATRRLSGRLEGALDPAAVIRNLPALPPKVRDVLESVKFSGPPARFDVALEHCGLAMEEWNGNLAVEVAGVSWRDLHVDRLVCPLRFDGGVLRTAPAIDVRLDPAGTQTATCEVALDTRARRLTARGTLALCLDRLYRELRLPDSRLLRELSFQGPPARIEFALADAPLDPLQWQVRGSVEARDFHLETLPVQHVSAAFTADAQGIEFADVRAESPDFERFDVDSLKVAWRTGTLELRGEIECDPLILGVFIESGNPRRWYERVWGEFRWTEDAPHLCFEKLRYESQGSHAWTLDLVTLLDGAQVEYRGLAADGLQAEIVAHLPAQLEVRHIDLRSPAVTVRGNMLFDLDGDSALDFACSGTFDPVSVFSTVLPELRSDLADFGTALSTRVEMSGRVNLSGPSRPRIQCTLEGEELRFHRLVTGRYSGDWQLVEQDVRWNLSEAEFCGGALYVAGNHSGFLGASRVEVGARDVSVDALIEQLQPERAAGNLGKLSGTAEITIQRRGAGRPGRITGSGRAHIREGELWNTPILAPLGSLIGGSNVGRISTLNADLEFLGDRLHVPEFSTDGTILSLKGSGDYYWGPDRLNFKVSGQALKGTSVMPMVLRPLSWFFDAELTGPVKDCQWRMINPLRRILPGDDSMPEPESLPLPPVPAGEPQGKAP